MIAIEGIGLCKTYDHVQAVSNVSLGLEENKIYGLIGRNGAGKTTLLRLLSGHAFPTQGQARIYGQEVFENSRAMEQTCFVREREFAKYGRRLREIFSACRIFYPNWDTDLELKLISAFGLDTKKKYDKLSRGMESMVGIIKGLASRAPVTLFDEPTLGLDAAHRELFYDVLLEDYSAHPRTIVLSTHLIDEVGKIIEEVLVMDRGQLKFQEGVDDLLEQGRYLSGPKALIDEVTRGREVLHREELGNTAIAAVWGRIEQDEESVLIAQGVDVSLIPLQKLFVYLTGEKGGIRA